MNAEKAGLLQDTWHAKYGGKVCFHSRIIEKLEPKTRRNAQHVVCRECGAIIPDPYKQVAKGLVVHLA
jgi:hypothetical protein